MNNKMIKNKKSQEEMVGFVLIIVLVAVIAVVFLGISLRKPSQTNAESENILAFISAVSEVTTECQISKNHLSVGELVSACEKSRPCDGGKPACSVLSDTLEEIMSKAYVVEMGSFRTFYNLTLSYIPENRPLIEPIISGSCKGSKIYNDKLFDLSFSDSKIKMRLEVCYEGE